MYLYVQACVTICLPVLLCMMYVSIRASMCHHTFTCIAVHDVSIRASMCHHTFTRIAVQDVCTYTCKHVSPYVYPYCCARCMYLCVQACVTIRLPVLLCMMYVCIRASMCHHTFTRIAVQDVCIYVCKHVSPYVYLYCCA